MNQESIIDKFAEKLDGKDFVQANALVKAGVFGSSTAVRNALKKGTFPSLRVSSHRTLIPTAAVIEYLRNSLQGAAVRG